MNTFFISTLLLTSICCTQGKGPGQPVFACNMKALSTSDRQRLPKVMDQLAALGPKVSDLPNGYRISFKDNHKALGPVAEWIVMESKCCSFFSFNIQIKPNGGPLTVDLFGPKGAKEFIDEEIPELKALAKSSAKPSHL